MHPVPPGRAQEVAELNPGARLPVGLPWGGQSEHPGGLGPDCLWGSDRLRGQQTVLEGVTVGPWALPWPWGTERARPLPPTLGKHVQ